VKDACQRFVWGFLSIGIGQTNPELVFIELLTERKEDYLCRPLAQVAELVDAHVSGACAARRGGSTPFLGTQVN
jgi:hypothetical protein